MRRLLPFALVAALALAPVVGSGSVAAAPGDPVRRLQWYLDTIGAEAGWRVATGSGVVVAVVDSGVDASHEDLTGQLVAGRDFVEDDDDPQDANGHGTHIAGLIAAAAGNGRGGAGVAPGAKVMPVRVLDGAGNGELSDVLDGVRWAVANGADVVNLSLAEDQAALLGPDLSSVVREAWAAGVIPVVAAGNDAVAGFGDEPAVVVGATNRSDTAPSYGRGVGRARWGMAAPGGELPSLGRENAILSTYWTGTRPNQYAYLAGTSQAAALVSGALAVLLSTGRFTPEQAVQRLLETARDVGAPGRDQLFGAGRLDLAAAVAGLEPGSASTTAPVPPAVPQAQPAPAPATAPSPPPSTVVPPTTAELSRRRAGPAPSFALRSTGEDEPSVGGVEWVATALAALLWARLGMGVVSGWRRRRG